jgi:hypothetical protein
VTLWGVDKLFNYSKSSGRTILLKNNVEAINYFYPFFDLGVKIRSLNYTGINKFMVRISSFVGR